MKRKYYFMIVLMVSSLAVLTTSCSSEENTVAPTVAVAPAAARAPEVLAFREAMINQIKERSKMGKQANEASAEMKENRQIVDAARKLLLATGQTQEELQSKTANSNAVLISMALKEYAKQLQPNH